MKVLAVETATTVCSAAVVVDGEVVAERTVNEQYVHAERLMGLIEECLHTANCSLNGIDGFAISIGPGSFTGLRIGLAMVKGFSYALEKPIAPVPTLEALADTLVEREMVKDREHILPLIDARRDEVYAQLFRVESGRSEAVWEPRDIRVSALAMMIGNDMVTVTGDGREKFRSALEHGRQDTGRVRFAGDAEALCSAAAVGRLGERMLLAGNSADPVTIEPLYVKRFYTITKRTTGWPGLNDQKRT